MRYRLIAAVLLLSVAGLTGCSATNIADLVKAAGQDQASVCASVTTIYGVLRFARTNLTGGNIACDQNGMTMKSDAQQIGVPIVVTPSVSVGPPIVGPPVRGMMPSGAPVFDPRDLCPPACNNFNVPRGTPK